MSSESEDDMTTKILSNANLTKRNSGYFLPGRGLPLTTVRLIYVAIVDGNEVDTEMMVTGEIRGNELRIYRIEGRPEAVDEFVSPQDIGAKDHQGEILRQVVEDFITCEVEDLEVKFLCL